ncbi:DNA polymerase/3'-5' exonuclease PolX [candidate division WOR-3 bacterium]|nr:DNA polymerase/3'-5' exonuclease PolX [candidate division WOR-3 bacterium]
MKNFELAKIFSKIADALEIKGENQFKVLAYRKVARILKDFPEDIEEICRSGNLNDVPGIGEGIAKKIKEYIETGKMKKYEEAMANIPEGLVELLNIQNLGPKTIKLAYEKLGVKNISDLEKVIKDGSLSKLPNMGEKKIENIKKGIELYKSENVEGEKRYPIGLVEPIVEEIVNRIGSLNYVVRVLPAGSYRRMKETVGDLDFLVISKEGKKVIDFFTGSSFVERILASGDTKGSIIEKNLKIQIDMRVLSEESFGSALQYFTGSKAHNIKIRSIAKEKGLKVSEYGVYKGEKKIAGEDEKTVYKSIGMEWIPPEMREDRGEVELALKGILPQIISYKDIKGDLHIHSKYSDGANSIDEIAKKAIEMGYDYIGIADHSQTAKYAHGLEIERLLKRNEEIDELNKKYRGKLVILKGTEVDILQDGSLDYPDEILKKLDFVIAAIHQGFKKNVTERMLSALDNPFVDIIAHPTGRLISGREGYEVNLEKVMEFAKDKNVALEINAYYDRLDLNETNASLANSMGIPLIINTDAHNLGMMRYMRLGIGIARRAWISPENIINTYDLVNLKRRLRSNG